MKTQASSSRKTLKKSDIAAAAVILLLCAVMIFIQKELPADGSFAAVFRDGEQVAALPLGTDGVFPFDELGVTVEVREHSVRVLHSDCNDKLCEKTGFISSSMQTVVCLPNRISVRIIGNTDSNIDVVLY